MTDFERVASDRGHDSVQHLFYDLYIRQGLSIDAVAEELHIGPQTTKRWLKKLGIQLRPRGGAQNVKITFTPELVEEITRDGVTAVSLRLGVDRTTLLHHLRRMKI